MFVRGVRTPFCLSGTDYEDYMAYDLQVRPPGPRSAPALQQHGPPAPPAQEAT